MVCILFLTRRNWTQSGDAIGWSMYLISRRILQSVSTLMPPVSCTRV